VSYANPTRGDRGQLPENPGNNKTPSPGISFPITPNSQQQPRTPEKSSVVTPKSKRAKPSSAAKKASSAKSGARPGSPASPRASAPEQVGKIQLPLPYVFLALLTKLTRRIRFWLKNPLNIPTVEISHNQGSWVRFWVTQNFSFTPLRRLRPLSKAPNTDVKRLLGGRVVSVATLPMMVSRLGWGSQFKSDPRLNAAGSLVKPVRDPWNLAGWVTPRQPRSR